MIKNIIFDIGNVLVRFQPDEAMREIDGKVISAMVGMIKPDAGIYQCLFDKYNLNPEECVFIDDRLENIEGGRKLGMEGIVFTDYETGKKKLERMLSEK